MPIETAVVQALEWRMIGPHRGGRVVAVAGDPVDPMTFYFGACGGGVWKSTDGGTYWENLSDGYFKTAPVGALAVAGSDPNVIYAGMGEACIRGNVIHGDGVYRSTDRGQSWKHLGLEDTLHIARIRIHPQNPDLVYVAALGHAFGPNQQRGVFRSSDGGTTWEQVLFRSENAGACDLSIDPSNPRILFAAIWETRRTPWTLDSGGPGSGLFRSLDGGDTWTEITENPGLPGGLKGRIGVAVSPARSGRVWALVEAEQGGLFRSDDNGETWEMASEDRDLRQRPWYYMHVFADPQDAETVYVLNLRMTRSTDGGRTFTQMPTPHGDNHELWIDPRDPRRMIEGNDGGACVSFNGGATWSTIYNQPTAQFYHVAVDRQFPYRVYGTQQDNSAISVPSRSKAGGIPWLECYPVGTSESGHIQVRPDNPNIVYSGAVGSAPGGGGALLSYDHGTGQTRIITVWPEVYSGWGAKELKYRFQWTFPILISPHDANVLYTTGNHVFRSTDEGTSWQEISPDLTRNDVDKLGPSGGPITKDTTGAEHYCTIFAFCESLHDRGVLWAGSDDGLLHLSRDNGKSWQNVTPPSLPEWATIMTIEPSPHDAATVYVAATRYKLDDFRPLLFKSTDYGESWTDIAGGFGDRAITRVVRADPARQGLLYAGTEDGVYVSFDDGAAWHSLQANLPPVPVHDLAVKESDLVAATHGRSFWILDDLTPLRQLSAELERQRVHLFAPRPTYRTRPLAGAGRPAAPGKNYNLGLGAALTYTETKKPNGEVVRTFLDAGKNPPDGVIITYYLEQDAKDEAKLTILDEQGKTVRGFSSKAKAGETAASTSGEAAEGVEGGEGVDAEELTAEPVGPVTIAAGAGAHRFVWNLRYADAHKVPGEPSMDTNVEGPPAAPGRYQVQLIVDGQTVTVPFEIVKDPRVRANQEDLDAQFELLLQIRDKLSETHDAVNTIRGIKEQVDAWLQRSGAKQGAAAAAARGLLQKLQPIEDELIGKTAPGALDRLHFPVKLNGKLAALTSVVASADAIPTQQSYAVFAKLAAEIDTQRAQLNEVVNTDVSALNASIRRAEVPAIVPL